YGLGCLGNVNIALLGSVCGDTNAGISLGMMLTFTFTFSHLADAFIQSDLQGCIHILHLWHTAHQEQLGVQCLAQGGFDRESNRATFLLLNDFSTSCPPLAPNLDQIKLLIAALVQT